MHQSLEEEVHCFWVCLSVPSFSCGLLEFCNIFVDLGVLHVQVVQLCLHVYCGLSVRELLCEFGHKSFIYLWQFKAPGV